MSDGKGLETRLKKLFTAEQERNSRFAFERLHDARAARGKFPPQPSDFLINTYNCTGRPLCIYLEAKETENEDKITIDSFSQFPRIYRKILAGATGLLVVYHTIRKLYRFVPLARFPISTRTFKLEGEKTYKKLDQLLEVIHEYDGC